MAIGSKVLLLAFTFSIVAFQHVQGRLHEGSEMMAFNSYGRSLLQSIDCDAACGSRCRMLQLSQETCKPACLTCCRGCNCVLPENPSSGADPCHCYHNMPTRWLPKCP